MKEELDDDVFKRMNVNDENPCLYVQQHTGLMSLNDNYFVEILLIIIQ